MTEFLWEIGCEEIPAAMLAQGIRFFAEAMENQLQEAGLHQPGSTRIECQGTPRRLMVSVLQMASRQADRVEEMRGPPVDRAFDAQGRPSKAAEGFARSCGVTVPELKRLETPKGAYLCHTIQRPGQGAGLLLPGIMTRILEEFPWPKTQRWGGGRMRFVRPINWMVALLDGEVLDFATVDGLKTGRLTQGHRFMARGPFAVSGVEDYRKIMVQGRVILEMGERQRIIAEGVRRLAADVGGRAVMPAALLAENANLTEWPLPLLGRFDPAYLAIPPEVLTTSMKNHQKYFPIEDAHGVLMSCFIAISNSEVPDPALVVRGYERVLRARLEDAAFYWGEDSKHSLESRLEMLKKVVFQAKLGSLYDKTMRVERLAVFLVEKGQPRGDIGHSIAQNFGWESTAIQSPGFRVNKGEVTLGARLCKCDLVSGMVGQFPELQGIMGGYYAQHSSAPASVVQAIREHYRPQGAADSLPESLEGRLISMADKLDTLVGCFGIGLAPTGAKDPFALRRAALGVIRILLDDGRLRYSLVELLEFTFDNFKNVVLENSKRQTVDSLVAFFFGRLKSHLKTDGFDHDLIDAVQDLVHGKDLHDVGQRVGALDKFRELPSYGALVAANKRIANILQKAGEDWRNHTLDTKACTDEAEGTLLGHLDGVDLVVKDAVARGAYGEALDHLARLRPAIDAFFDQVLVMDPDPFKRLNRLALLSRVRDVFQRVADVSRLSAPEA
ncbi:MAG: glycyl-tRNA synthetase beta chain [Magnetococcales bacterium]|nr:glycyl-tRNA synthetase beta chain [Magnetococcales bacterium]HIJ84098.1 glycine--tRNA ligase subunit beta [Magnetococcales bacterium]